MIIIIAMVIVLVRVGRGGKHRTAKHTRHTYALCLGDFISPGPNPCHTNGIGALLCVLMWVPACCLGRRKGALAHLLRCNYPIDAAPSPSFRLSLALPVRPRILSIHRLTKTNAHERAARRTHNTAGLTLRLRRLLNHMFVGSLVVPCDTRSMLSCATNTDPGSARYTQHAVRCH